MTFKKFNKLLIKKKKLHEKLFRVSWQLNYLKSKLLIHKIQSKSDCFLFKRGYFLFLLTLLIIKHYRLQRKHYKLNQRIDDILKNQKLKN